MNNKGFTLIELLAVLAVMITILLIAIPSISSSIERNKDKFDKMKDRTVLINIARGGIIDEQAMIDALKSGKLMGAGLDVFETEPLGEDSPLWSISNVLISPHNSFVSDKTADRLFEVILTNLKAFAEEV